MVLWASSDLGHTRRSPSTRARTAARAAPGLTAASRARRAVSSRTNRPPSRASSQPAVREKACDRVDEGEQPPFGDRAFGVDQVPGGDLRRRTDGTSGAARGPRRVVVAVQEVTSGAVLKGLHPADQVRPGTQYSIIHEPNGKQQSMAPVTRRVSPN